MEIREIYADTFWAIDNRDISVEKRQQQRSYIIDKVNSCYRHTSKRNIIRSHLILICIGELPASKHGPRELTEHIVIYSPTLLILKLKIVTDDDEDEWV